MSNKMQPQRPTRYLHNFGRKFPGLWSSVDSFRQAYKSNWPEWCFLPLNSHLAMTYCDRETPLGYTWPILAAWRTTQGIYRFDDETLEELWNSPIEGEIPTSVLWHTPEWCPYIQTNERSFVFSGTPATLHGFFASLDHGIDDKVQSLLFLFDIQCLGKPEGLLLPVILPMTLGAGVSATVSEMLALFMQEENNPFFDDDPGLWVSPEHKSGTHQVLNDLVPGAISLFLYICSVNAEFRDSGGSDRAPRRPAGKKTSDGIRFFPPERPIVWETAWRIGAAIRSQVNSSSRESENGKEKVRPHVRRAHWHTFLTGPINGPRDARVKWLPPIAVNVAAAGGLEALIPVVRNPRGSPNSTP